jgi:hypothetical protein
MRRERTNVKNFIKRFVREPDGTWRCNEPAELYLPNGKRIQVAIGARFKRGQIFMGVDLARLLDEEFERTRQSH